jgi:predicted permease
MIASVALVFAIACANVTCLLLARAVGRRREFAVQLAIGASRRRISRDALIESLILSATAGAVSVVVLRWIAAGIRGLMPYELAIGFEPDMTVFMATLGGAALAGLLVGFLPARHAARTDLMTVMRDAGGPPPGRIRGALVVAQVALSFVLVAGSVVLVRSLLNAAAARPGFNPDHVVTATIGLSPGEWDDVRAAALTDAISARVRQIPGAGRVALARRLPVVDAMARRSVERPDGDLLEAPLAAPWTAVDAGYFSTMGVPIARGRAFTPDDRRGSPNVAIVSESLARRLWGSADPVGQTLRAGPDLVRVVGVAADTAALSLRDHARLLVYVPLAQQRAGDLTIVVRSEPSVPPAALIKPLRAALAELAPGVPIARVALLRDRIGDSVGETRLVATVLGLYGGIALLLSSAGLYALQAHVTRQRRHEFGVRLALGASPRVLQCGVLASALKLSIAGVLAGLGIVLVAERAVRRLVFEVHPLDPLSLSVAAGVFAACTLAAAVGPARHAATIDPIASLRQE